MMRQFYCRYEDDKKSIEMRSLNLDQLRALVEVTEQGSFSAAARRLNLTQPAVGLQIGELEGRIGLLLVEDHGRIACGGTQPTCGRLRPQDREVMVSRALIDTW
jgi:hypothetical protein